MTKSRRKGFTIVEMLAVIGVIAVLATIIVTAAAGSITSSRERRRSIMRRALEQGIAAYYAQEGRWPTLIEQTSQTSTDDKDTVEFRGSQADKIFQEVVGKGFGRSGRKSMLIDASALFVCDSGSANSDYARGYQFSEVTGRNAKHRIALDQMAFGYQENRDDDKKKRGCFRRFYIVYNCRTDNVIVEPKFDDD